jgi:hypothetical protein
MSRPHRRLLQRNRTMSRHHQTSRNRQKAPACREPIEAQCLGYCGILQMCSSALALAPLGRRRCQPRIADLNVHRRPSDRFPGGHCLPRTKSNGRTRAGVGADDPIIRASAPVPGAISTITPKIPDSTPAKISHHSLSARARQRPRTSHYALARGGMCFDKGGTSTRQLIHHYSCPGSAVQ